MLVEMHVKTKGGKLVKETWSGGKRRRRKIIYAIGSSHVDIELGMY